MQKTVESAVATSVLDDTKHGALSSECATMERLRWYRRAPGEQRSHHPWYSEEAAASTLKAVAITTPVDHAGGRALGATHCRPSIAGAAMLAPLLCAIDRKSSSEGRGEHVGDSMDGSVGAPSSDGVGVCEGVMPAFLGRRLGRTVACSLLDA